jgi:signal transduction histidine kinase
MHKNLEEYLPFLIEELSSKESHSSIDERWKSVLEKFFSQKALELINEKLESCELSDNGMSLQIPAITQSQCYKLKAINSQQLFTENDVQLANALLKLTGQFVSIQEALEQGASTERQRIARDLHDDVAARMLTLIHQAKDQKSIDLARSILKSLRNAIYTLDNKSTTTILDALTDIRAEIQDRLNSIGMQLQWQHPDEISNLIFTPRQHINLHRILHEITTNIIRHTEAHFVNIDIELSNNNFHVYACDDGSGFSLDECIPGKGINNIKTRVNELNGRVTWKTIKTEAGEDIGCCVDILFPILINKATS